MFFLRFSTIAMLFVVVLLLGTCYDIVFVQVPKWHALSAQSHILQHGDNEGHVSLNIKHHSDENAPLLDKEIVYRHEPSMSKSQQLSNCLVCITPCSHPNTVLPRYNALPCTADSGTMRGPTWAPFKNNKIKLFFPPIIFVDITRVL